MKFSEYAQVYRKVSEDNAGRNPLMWNILEKKVVQDVKRRYHKLMKSSLAEEWASGSTLLELSRKHNFPPVLLSKMIRKTVGPSQRLCKEAAEAEKHDRFYSKHAIRRSAENGAMVEEIVARWFSDRGAKFLRGDELEGSLHPDLLFLEPVELNGQEVNWVECKYYFGSSQDMKKHWEGQLEKYLNAFGPGAIVYWLGFVEDRVPGDEHLVLSGEMFKQNN